MYTNLKIEENGQPLPFVKARGSSKIQRTKEYIVEAGLAPAPLYKKTNFKLIVRIVAARHAVPRTRHGVSLHAVSPYSKSPNLR
jgi:hypothetical protein